MEDLLNFNTDNSTSMLVAGLICGFVISVAGILLALVRRRTANSGNEGQIEEKRPKKEKPAKPPKPAKNEKLRTNPQSPGNVVDQTSKQEPAPASNILPPVSHTAPLDATNENPPGNIDLRQKLLANAAKPAGPTETSELKPQETNLPPAGPSHNESPPSGTDPLPPEVEGKPLEVDQETFLQGEEEEEKPAINDAFSIFTDMEAEETETSKFAKTLNNVDIKDLHEEIRDVAEQLKGWR
jgi:hypothetical protein